MANTSNIHAEQHNLHFRIDHVNCSEEVGGDGKRMYTISNVRFLRRNEGVQEGVNLCVKARTLKVAFEMLEAVGTQIQDMSPDVYQAFKAKHDRFAYLSARIASRNEGLNTEEHDIVFHKPDRTRTSIDPIFGKDRYPGSKRKITLNKKVLEEIKEYAKRYGELESAHLPGKKREIRIKENEPKKRVVLRETVELSDMDKRIAEEARRLGQTDINP